MFQSFIHFASQFPVGLPLSVIAYNPHFVVLNTAISYFGAAFLLLSVLFNWLPAAVWKSLGWFPEKQKECFSCGLIALGSAITVFILGLYTIMFIPVFIIALFMRELKK